MNTYASQSDLAAWLNPAGVPQNADRLLRSATIAVAEACNRNPYTDAPSADDAPPLRDAVCAQVASWTALGIDPDKQGVGGTAPVVEAKLLTADVKYDTTVQRDRAARAIDDLSPEATAILTTAGLLWQPVPLVTGGNLPRWGQSVPLGCCDPTSAASIDAYSADAYGYGYGYPFGRCP